MNDKQDDNNLKKEFSLTKLIYKFDLATFNKNQPECSNSNEKINCYKQKTKSSFKKTFRFGSYRSDSNKSSPNSPKPMDFRRNAIDFEHSNNLDDDQNSAIENIIINTIQSKLESNANDMALIRTLSAMPARFKEAFEGILKTNRVEDFDETQNFRKIQDKHSISNPFVDTTFRPCNTSIFYTESFRNWLISLGKADYRGNFIWKRAKDLYPNPQFAVDDSDKNYLSVYNKINEKNYKALFRTTDLDQGSLGAFHFRFWIYGTWKDVVIDDYLPVGPDNKLIFCKNRDVKNEFWCALLEKAYAKVCGCYEALEGGFTTDALIDMSGGIEEIYNLINIRKTLYSNRFFPSHDTQSLDHKTFWSILIEARRKFSVIGCNIELDDPNQKEVRLSNGLVQGHAYIITKVAELEKRDETFRLIRLYNPWGNDVEWNGDWSDRSQFWNMVDRNTKEKLELKIENDGEFWMSFEDWLRNFDNCQICNLTPDTINDISEKDWENSRLLSNIFSMWQCQMFHGRWISGVSAGGRAKYWTNPQYTFIITENDYINNDGCWVIISLMQKYTRQKRIQLKSETTEEYIQFRIYQIKNLEIYYESLRTGEPILPSDLIRVNSSGSYTNKREVTGRFHLHSGAFVIVPSIYDEDVEGEFLIRIFTEKPLSKKSLETSNRRATVQYKCNSTEIDDDDLMRDIQELSGGASKVFNRFVHIANDFTKTASKKRNDKNSRFSFDDYASETKSNFFNSPNNTENKLGFSLSPNISCNPKFEEMTFSPSARLASHKEMYKSPCRQKAQNSPMNKEIGLTESPTWRNAYKKRCFDEFKKSRQKLINRFRSCQINDASKKTKFKDYLEEELEKICLLEAESNAISVDEALEIYKQIQEEIIPNDLDEAQLDELLKSQEREELMNQDSIYHALSDEFSRIFCPICQKEFLVQENSVIYCKNFLKKNCNFRINCYEARIDLPKLAERLNTALVNHNCSEVPSFQFKTKDQMSQSDLILINQLSSFPTHSCFLVMSCENCSLMQSLI
ncbi:calpain-3 isoform X2 [Brachionus plicatilis]|uniref:Calpain-3 isoform X2 n=1 Tax=Brachionus plicatilis TaxID=10195 RepID=A0A3M7P7L7_BRAPC|nr:calpain-3 isoform X2 [Brachionus plicatilis]